MGRISTAFRAFFGALFNYETASRVNFALVHPELVIPDQELAAPVQKPVEVAPPVPPKPRQSEALTLLATLQREARLVDFLKEDLNSYSNEQVGAAVREIHRDSATVINRLFAVQPILADEEGSSVVVPVGFDAAQYRLTGNLAGAAPFHGTLRHRGWEATRCELPAFTGGESAAKTIAPVEVEIV